MNHLNKQSSSLIDYNNPINTALELTRRTKLIALSFLYYVSMNSCNSNNIDPNKRVYEKSVAWKISDIIIGVIE
jgi:hypothetical protein